MTSEASVLLRHDAVGEADLRVWFLGAERGLFVAMAKGARKSRRRFMGRLEPFSRAWVRTAKHRGGDYLEEVTPRSRTDAIPGDLGRYYLACYACELISRNLQRDDPAPDTFDLLEELLERLQAPPGPDDQFLRAAFEARFLHQQGLLPVEAMEGQGTFDTVQGEWVEGLDARAGPGRVGLAEDALELLRGMVTHPMPEAAPEVDRGVLRRVNRLTARLVAHQLPGRPRSAGLLNAHQAKALAEA